MGEWNQQYCACAQTQQRTHREYDLTPFACACARQNASKNMSCKRKCSDDVIFEQARNEQSTSNSGKGNGFFLQKTDRDRVCLVAVACSYGHELFVSAAHKYVGAYSKTNTDGDGIDSFVVLSIFPRPIYLCVLRQPSCGIISNAQNM